MKKIVFISIVSLSFFLTGGSANCFWPFTIYCDHLTGKASDARVDAQKNYDEGDYIEAEEKIEDYLALLSKIKWICSEDQAKAYLELSHVNEWKCKLHLTKIALYYQEIEYYLTRNDWCELHDTLQKYDAYHDILAEVCQDNLDALVLISRYKYLDLLMEDLKDAVQKRCNGN